MEYANIFESNLPALQGERATEKAHRKVELQSPADLTYLRNNVMRAAREKIDRHLPPDAAPEAGEDEMKKRVEVLVDDYVRATFNAARDGISINGMDSAELDAELAKGQGGEEIEPFDSKLAQRIQALSAQIENHTLQLANLRRNAPAEIAQKFRKSFERDSERFEAMIGGDEDARIKAAKNTTMDIGEIERIEDVQYNWQKGSEGLVDLKAGLGGTVAKMEKAQKAVDYLGEK